MSANRNAEIKIRVTPDEKARWQAYADAEGESLSTMIRSSMNREVRTAKADELTAKQVVVLDPKQSIFQTLLSKSAYDVLHAGHPKRVVLEAPGHDSLDKHCPHGTAAWQFCGECGV